jgi:3-hydroxymyristoyl/3-hydroxydecanoyl-(acyl carrier protein) dehydratase
VVARTPQEVARRPVLIDVKVAQGHVDGALLVTPDLVGFAGHFPDFPILPGVVQLDWAVYYAQEFLCLEEPVVRVERLKFTCPISPNTSLRLSLSYDADKSSVDFRFYRPIAATSDGARELLFSQGRLIYSAEPAG